MKIIHPTPINRAIALRVRGRKAPAAQGRVGAGPSPLHPDLVSWVGEHPEESERLDPATLAPTAELLDYLTAHLEAGETECSTAAGLRQVRRRVCEALARIGGPDPGMEGVVITSGEGEALFTTLLSLGLTDGGTVRLLGQARRHVPLLAMLGVKEATPEDPGLAGVPRVVCLWRAVAEPDGRCPAGAMPDDIFVGTLDGLPGMPPFRLGFAAGPPGRIREVARWKEAWSVSSPIPSQRAAVFAFGGAEGDRGRSSVEATHSGRADGHRGMPPVIVTGTRDRARHPVRANPIRGLGELRRAVTHRYAEDRWLDLDPERCIIITNGAQEALFLAIMALVNPGDAVAVPDPCYGAYARAVEAAGGHLVSIPTGSNGDFRLRPEDVRERAAGAKALVFVNPGNPTGTCVEPDGVQEIADAAREAGLIVVYDEAYGDLVEVGKRFQSMAACRGMQDSTVTIGGFSHTYAMSGLRVGYLIAEPEFIESAAALKSAVSGPCPIFSQHAALAAMDADLEIRPRMQALYAGRRAAVTALLNGMGIPYAAPGGGPYVWADLSAEPLATGGVAPLLDAVGEPVLSGHEFGPAWSSWARIDALSSDERLAAALARLRGHSAPFDRDAV